MTMFGMPSKLTALKGGGPIGERREALAERAFKTYSETTTADAAAEIKKANVFLESALTATAEIVMSSRIPIGVELKYSPGRAALNERVLLLLTGCSGARVKQHGRTALLGVFKKLVCLQWKAGDYVVVETATKPLPNEFIAREMWVNYVEAGEPSVLKWGDIELEFPVGRASEVLDLLINTLRKHDDK